MRLFRSCLIGALTSFFCTTGSGLAGLTGRSWTGIFFLTTFLVVTSSKAYSNSAWATEPTCSVFAWIAISIASSGLLDMVNASVDSGCPFAVLGRITTPVSVPSLSNTDSTYSRSSRLLARGLDVAFTPSLYDTRATVPSSCSSMTLTSPSASVPIVTWLLFSLS